MQARMFHPAPSGLPVAVEPPRGGAATLEKLQRMELAPLVRAGALWLHGFIDEAHEIAQGEESAEGSYWHALVHRSEGDFGNSLYWFERVGRHAIFPELRDAVGALEELPRELRSAKEWEPRRIVDLCKKARGGRRDDAALLARVAAIEYNLLMSYVLEKTRETKPRS